ncbi:hypothetical protein Tco_0013806 [Tanacetum coccineum]
MEDLDMTIEEYVQYENEKALRNDKVYNWEIAMYGKICTWMAFGGNIRDLGSFGEETHKTTTLQQISWKNTYTVRGHGTAISCDDVRSYKRRRQEIQDDVRP